jgi:hypothetical protein
MKAAMRLKWSGLSEREVRLEGEQRFWAALHPTRRPVKKKPHYVLAPTPKDDRGAQFRSWLLARGASPLDPAMG